jgi:uncharacterized protein (TIRG00374 family)
VNSVQRFGKLAGRLLICGLLLAWIFHAIFCNEARLALERQGRDWYTLSRLEMWRTAWTLGPQELWQTLTLIDPLAFSLSLAAVGVTILLGILRWQMVLRVQGLNLPFTRAAEISLIAQFFNSFLLGSTGGDLLKAYYAARETHHKKTEAVTTVFVDRLIGLFSMLLFACLMMLPNSELLRSHQPLIGPALVVMGMTLACSGLAYLAFWGGISQRWPGARMWLRQLPKGEMLERSLTACRRFGSEWRLLLKAILLSLVINAFTVLHLWILARGLNLTISLLALFVIVPMVTCISALPITPSGLGVRENLYVIMLAVPAINVEPTPALSLSLLGYAGTLVWSLIGGIVYLCVKDKEHLEEITTEKAGAGENDTT